MMTAASKGGGHFFWGGVQRVAQRVMMTIKHGDIRTIKMVAAESSNGRSNGRDQRRPRPQRPRPQRDTRPRNGLNGPNGPKGLKLGILGILGILGMLGILGILGILGNLRRLGIVIPIVPAPQFSIRRLQMWPRLRDWAGYDILGVFPIQPND